MNGLILAALFIRFMLVLSESSILSCAGIFTAEGKVWPKNPVATNIMSSIKSQFLNII